ncbi:DUF2809 domain-containing protein [Fulvivirga kasyanovii]|uniref:DUF2809 domain-containing protein n=1 Tax=Fulvivirga kasyanovii TaxID=396812 RepID=A0ABW9RWC9_9BACT|nr:DUF2809 domain-containing protein [Fulvivirga kasyanovii]MTI28508.1 DUF2809 domain-containing protein [Fulvivirga kasyanovii]
MFKFQKKYFFLTIGLLITEILIALYVHDRIIRPYIGDLLVVILIYTFFKSFLNVPVTKMALAVLLFSYAVEAGQYFGLVYLLGLEDYKIARIIIGVSFEWLDLIAYTAGIILVLTFDKPKTDKAVETT